MSNPNGGHWFQLPLDPQYFNFAACSQVKQDIRFFDNSDQTTTLSHEDAICTVDCLMPHKNAILQLITFESFGTGVDSCVSPSHCGVELLNPSTLLVGTPVGPLCFPGNQTNINAGNWINRVKIFDITWANTNVSGKSDLNDPDGKYFASSQGSLTNFNDPIVDDWITSLKISNYPHFAQVVQIAEVLNNCSKAPDTSAQEALLDYCRQVYTTALGTNLVGATAPLTPVPGVQDKKPFMFDGCQYVYDITESKTGGVCPAINTLCSDPAFKGNWKFSLSTLGGDALIQALGSHFCQSFFRAEPVPPPPNLIISIGYAGDSPYNVFYAGMGRSPSGLIRSVEPQSSASLIYRSCALEEYTGDQANCCANDFADGEDSITFHPTISQSPRPSNIVPVTSQRIPLFGYDYANEGTPWYENCFDASGTTCDPNYRDITSKSFCVPLMIAHCIGISNVDPNAVADSWSSDSSGSGECMKWLGRLLYGSKGAWIQFPSTVQIRGLLRDRTGTNLSSDILDLFTKNMSKFFTMRDLYNTKSGPPLSELNSRVEEVMFTLYKSYNLIFHDGNSVLDQCSVFNIDDVRENALLRRWCGCALQTSSYASVYPGVSIECTPTCNSSDVLQIGIACVGTQCILDDITISIIDSQGGTASLSQVCQSCGKIVNNDDQQIRETCSCLITKVDIEVIASKLGRIDINEICGLAGNGGSSTTAPRPPAIERAAIATKDAVKTFPFSIVSLLLIVGLLALFFLIYMKAHPDARNWAKVLGIAFLIIFLLALAAITYYVTVFTL